MLDSYDACNIIKEYSGVRILHGINFRIQSGTIHGLFGHNGAGKSTLLKVMAGVEKPEDGTLQLKWRNYYIIFSTSCFVFWNSLCLSRA